MSKAGDIAKVSAKGSFHVLWGLVISTIISSLGTIFIARLLGSDLYGLYTVVLTVPTIIQVFRDWGINSAMVRFTAQFRAEGRFDEVRSIFLIGIIFEVSVGLALSLFSFFSADFLAASIFNRPVIAPLIQIVSFSILASGLIAAATAAFTGYERLEFNSVMLVFQSVIKTGVIIALVILGFGTAGAAIGYTVSTAVAGIIGVILIGVIYRQLPKPSTRKLELKAYFSTMLTYCLPLSFATIITALLPQFYAFLLPIHYVTDNVAIGNYGIALNFVVLISFFIVPISTVMFPAFSKLDAEKDKESLRNIFRFSVKYGSLLVVPPTVLVMCLAEPAVATLFGDTYTTAGLFLALFAIQYLFVAFGNISLSAILIGQGKTGFVLRMAILAGAIGFPLGYALIMSFGVIGLIAATIIFSVPGLIWALIYIKRIFGTTVDWGSSARILLSSAFAGVLTYVVVSQVAFAAWILLLLGAVLYVVAVVPALLLSRSITRADIANLRSMLGGVGALGGLIGKVLSLVERLMALLRV
ncbi:MAG: oligosaccharide flippase family protein [Candidatus Bathyarchaeota archaeon]|nr:oligosaccharide flippase family protein [Candidatus Bathyarchaeota archaeon]